MPIRPTLVALALLLAFPLHAQPAPDAPAPRAQAHIVTNFAHHAFRDTRRSAEEQRQVIRASERVIARRRQGRR